MEENEVKKRSKIDIVPLICGLYEVAYLVFILVSITTGNYAFMNGVLSGIAVWTFLLSVLAGFGTGFFCIVIGPRSPKAISGFTINCIIMLFMLCGRISNTVHM